MLWGRPSIGGTGPPSRGSPGGVPLGSQKNARGAGRQVFPSGGGVVTAFLTGDRNPFTFVPLWPVYGEGMKVACSIGRGGLVRVPGSGRSVEPYAPATGGGP